MPKSRPRILVTGASGFVGHNLVARLERLGADVVTCSRTRPAGEGTAQWIHCDFDEPGALDRALQGIDVAYYLVHGMGGAGTDYTEREAKWARDFTAAAHAAGTRRIVYLGGVAPSGEASPHLESRLETGRRLRAGPVEVVELRAGVIVGLGSASWRIIRDLAVRLPVMILPRWMKTRSQPIALSDVIDALVRAADPDVPAGVYGNPGPEILSAEALLVRVARLLGTRPLRWSVPFVSPRLSSHWIRWVTRADPHIATELVAGMASDLVCGDPPFWTHMPDHDLVPFDEAARLALRVEQFSLPFAVRVLEAAIHRVSIRPSS